MPEFMDARTCGCFHQASEKELIEQVYIRLAYMILFGSSSSDFLMLCRLI